MVSAYFDHFTDGRPGGAAALMHPVFVGECGGPQAMREAIAEAGRRDRADYRVTAATFRRDADPPHVMARLEVRAPGSSPGSTDIAIGVAREDGRWYLAEIHPAQVSLACGT